LDTEEVTGSNPVSPTNFDRWPIGTWWVAKGHVARATPPSRGGISMASLSGAVSDIGGAVRAVVGLSRPGRLRDQIDQTLDLYAKSEPHPALGAVSAALVEALENQTRALSHATDPKSKRKLNWGPFFVALILFDLPLAALTWWGYQFTDQWWGWAWTLLAGLATLFLVAATIYALVSQDDD
ncbi:MAG: hypothetical protein KC492_42685, partial [Myxococcales bacterium]|nr:hypothetical protein [Myxococcales bacterium]